MIFWVTTAGCLAVLIALLSAVILRIADMPGPVPGLPVALLVLIAAGLAAISSILLALGAARTARIPRRESSALYK